MEVNKENKIIDNCQVGRDALEDMLTHLADHGPSSLLLSKKFAPLISCFMNQIEIAITGEWAPAIRADIEQGATADETTESPAAVGFRLQSRRISTSYRQGRV